MDLLSQYSLLKPLRRVLLTNGEGFKHWDAFLNDDSDRICVVASRRIGKSSALLRRALFRKDRDVIFVSGSIRQTKMAVDDFCAILNTEGFRDVVFQGDSRHSSYREIVVNDHTIFFVDEIDGYMPSWFEGREIMFNEPEGFLGNRTDYFSRKRFPDTILTMVGSLFHLGPSTFKTFYRIAESEGYAKKITAEVWEGLMEELREQRGSWISEASFQREYMCRWEEEYSNE